MKAIHVAMLSVAVVIVIALSMFATVNGWRTSGLALETQLSAQFQSEQAWLAQFTNGFREQYALGKDQSAMVDTILTNAVQGRYGEDGFSADGAFFSAVQEAYPESSISQLLDNWNSISSYVAAGREEYARLQSNRLDMVRAYNLWLNSGFIRSSVVRALGFPSQNLKARVGETQHTGSAALAQMELAITNAETLDAYNSGTQEAMIGGE